MPQPDNSLSKTSASTAPVEILPRIWGRFVVSASLDRLSAGDTSYTLAADHLSAEIPDRTSNISCYCEDMSCS
jgi:hypothetical protein